MGVPLLGLAKSIYIIWLDKRGAYFSLVVESKNILIMLTITNKGCNDDSQEISEQLRSNVSMSVKIIRMLQSVPGSSY